MKICKITSNETVDYAASELRKYLHMMMPELGYVEICYDKEAKDGFRLGLMQDFGFDVSDVEDTKLDDIIYIETDTTGGIIAGDNPRSVLLAVYEYLRKNGCRWLMPGKSGEFIPMQDIVPVSYRHKATTRFRGWCNEGSISQESLLKFVEFGPKVGINTVKIQWRLPYGFYERHYEHLFNQENRSRDSVSKPQMLQWTKECEEEIKKRGLTLFVLGHGITIDGLGMDASACWRMDDKDVPEDIRPYLAQMNGKRKMFGDIPTNTNFCMSNPEARNRCTRWLVDYARKNSDADYINVGLADGMNNHCECDNCRKKSPSDWYVIWLNEIDAAMTKENIPTKLGFSLYVDCCWPPKDAKINNPDRFIMGAGFSFRSYTRTLRNDNRPVVLPEFSLNNNKRLNDLEEGFAMRRRYLSRAFDGKISIASEYHTWCHNIRDVSTQSLSRRIVEDLKVYKSEGFCGMIPFICPRNSFPNGCLFYTFARNAFDDSSAEELRADYFSYAYGEWADEVMEFFDRVEEVFDFEFIFGEKGTENKRYLNPEETEKLKKAEGLSKQAIAIADKMNKPLPVLQAISRKMLYYYGLYIKEIGEFLSVKASGEDERARDIFEKFRVEFGKLEAEIQDYYDHHMVVKAFREISDDLGFVIQ